MIVSRDQELKDDISDCCDIGLLGQERLTANSMSESIRLITDRSPDLVIADTELCGQSIFNLIKTMRLITNSPIIVVSYLRDESQYCKALECGADVYYEKPLHQLEFIARARSLLKNKIKYHNNSNTE